MGINELWKLVSPSTEGQTLTAFALEGLKGHVQDEGGLSMMTVSVDASAWLYAVCKLQAFRLGHAQSGENPELRTLMYKLVALASAPVHTHFIFDGEDHPPIKRGKHELLHIFGFTWATARGEAEADLAFLSKAGKISAVLMEDSDALLFGAEKVLRLTDNEDGTFIVDAYCAEALSNDPKMPLTTARLLLWAMLRGGDYNPGGLTGCGSQVSCALLAGDLSDSLMQVMTLAAPAQLPSMLGTWRDRLRTVLVDGTLGRKYPTLAASIPADFPSIDTMHLYLNPVTTWSGEASSSLLPKLDPTQPDLTRLTAFCEARLGRMRKKIHKYFRNKLWSAACMRALCQLQTNDGSTLPKPTFNVDKRKDPKGGVPVYCVTLYAPSFVNATNDGIQADDDLSPEESESWVPSHSKVTIPARIMELTSPQDVIDYSDQHATSVGPSSGDPPPDWHPCPSAQYAAVADMLWPEVGDMSSEVRDPELSGGSGLKVCTDEEGWEVIDLTVD
ncbi:PIN domain-like protein [Suillus ampliporus]|nr:PIN domain-like protein [Suillus ampliporus]